MNRREVPCGSGHDRDCGGSNSIAAMAAPTGITWSWDVGLDEGLDEGGRCGVKVFLVEGEP